MGCEHVVHMLVVFVQPSHFLGEQLFLDDWRRVDGAQAERLKQQELTKLRVHLMADNPPVLYAHSSPRGPE